VHDDVVNISELAAKASDRVTTDELRTCLGPLKDEDLERYKM